VVPDKSVQSFLNVAKARGELKIVNCFLHKDAPKFKAHDRFDYV